MPWLTVGLWIASALTAILALVFGPRLLLGLVVIGDDEIGIVTKKFGFKDLPAGHIVALNGEAGIQADTVPPGWHFGYWPWQYGVQSYKLELLFGPPPVPNAGFGLAKTTTIRFGCV